MIFHHRPPEKLPVAVVMLRKLLREWRGEWVAAQVWRDHEQRPREGPGVMYRSLREVCEQPYCSGRGLVG